MTLIGTGQVLAQIANTTPVPVPARVKPATPTKPEWKALSTGQQRALQPLAATWHQLSEGHKRKWLVLSVNFEKMSPAEQGLLHERMTEWVALSPAQRNQARLNFAEAKQLSPSEKQAKWEAYQALSEEDKQKLAKRAPKPPSGAATTVKPVARQKLATTLVDDHGGTTPAAPASPASAANVQPAALHRRNVDRNTLLPQQP